VLTLEEAKELQYHDVLVNAEGKRWRVNGQVQRWKRSPNRIRVPLKHGLYAYDAITDADFRDGKCEWLTAEG
jgi:hypothetical protein